MSKDKPTNGKFILQKEIEALVDDLINYFGDDMNSKGKFSKDEFSQVENWEGRIWKFEDYYLRLVHLNGYLQLYFDFNKK